MLNFREEFIKYLNEKYVDIFCEDITRFLEKNNQKILIVSRSITDLTALDNDDPDFQFKVKIETEYFYNLNTVTSIFVLEYKCKLDNGISELRLLDINHASKVKFKYSHTLSDSMIPYITKEKYEEYGERFAKRYYKSKWLDYPVNIDLLLNKMGLTRTISGSIDSLGKTVFKDCKVTLVTENNSERELALKKGTLIVNIKNYLLTGNETLVRSTTLHECIHWHYHKKAFEILMLLDSKYSYLDCKKYESTDPISEIFNLMEAQANAITNVVLMKKVNIENHLLEIINDANGNIEYNFRPQIDILHSFCSQMANDFNVTYTSMVKRLVVLNYDMFGALRNRNNVENFLPIDSDEILEENKSRCINREQFMVLYKNNEVLRRLIQDKIYVYVNGYVILNDKKYLEGDYPLQTLSQYAIKNIKECSICFSTIWKYHKVPLNSFSLITLNRDGQKGVCEVSIPDNEYDGIIEAIERTFEESRKKEFIKKYRVPVPNMHFSDYFSELMKKYNKTIGQLEIISGSSISTIKKYREYNYDGYSIEQVLIFASALKCYPYETHNLLDLAGFNINSESKRNEHYRHLVNECYGLGVKHWNDYLESVGEHRLNKL